MTVTKKTYSELRKTIYSSINLTKGNMVKLRQSSLLKKNEKEKITDVINTLEELRCEFLHQTKKDTVTNIKKILKNLDDNEDYYVEKIKLLLNLIQYPDVEHIIPNFLVEWCKSIGLKTNFNQDSHIDWWSCTVK